MTSFQRKMTSYEVATALVKFFRVMFIYVSYTYKLEAKILKSKKSNQKTVNFFDLRNLVLNDFDQTEI